MDEQGFVLRDVDYDGTAVAVIMDIQNPYEVVPAQSPYERDRYCYNA